MKTKSSESNKEPFCHFINFSDRMRVFVYVRAQRHRSSFMARPHWSVQLNWTIISNKSHCNLRLNKTRVSGYKTLVQRPTATGRRLIITRLSTVGLLMARCHRTMCLWWAWGCQQQQHEAGTTLSLARHLQTSCCYTSSLPPHFISKDTQEGETHWEARSWYKKKKKEAAESIWLGSSCGTREVGCPTDSGPGDLLLDLGCHEVVTPCM